MSKEEDLRRVILEQNPWFDLGGVPATLAPPVERPLSHLLSRRVQQEQPRRFQLILGPRRVGKTTVMYQMAQRLLSAGLPKRKLWWLRLDHPLILEFTLEEIVKVALEEGQAGADEPIYLLFDELVYAKNWDLWLKTFYDQQFPVRIVATSSATAALRERRLETGAGRWDEQFLMPYLFSEALELWNQDPPITARATLEETITSTLEHRLDIGDLEQLRQNLAFVGGFPELLLRSERSWVSDLAAELLESQRVLRTDAVERAIYKDIPQSFGVESPTALERLLYTLAGQVTGLLSPKKVCSELGMTQPTLDRYISYLERAFLLFTLSNYSGREATIQKRGRKLYFVDGAVRNAALQRGISPLRNSTEMGMLLENQVASHLHALSLQSQVRLFHWRDGDNEADFVYDQPGSPMAFEVAMSPDHSRAGLMALAERYPRLKDSCYMVAPGARLLQPSKGRGGVGTIPADLFLVMVSKQAERALSEKLSTPA